MADRRMFTKKITDADAFTSLPPTTQALYFHLCMGADDDGFSNQIRGAMFNAHADQNDFELLVRNRFLIPFDNGVVVIKHWKMHNIIRNDRYHETEYLEEKSTLLLKENGVYTENLCPIDEFGIPSDNQVTTNGIPSDNQMETEVRLGKDSIGKDRKGKYSCSEQSEITHEQREKIPTFINLPLNDGTEYGVPTKDVEEWKELYPAVDVEQELRNMRGWILAEKTRRKTRRGINRFINGWLSKSQDKSSKTYKNQINDFDAERFLENRRK